MTRIDHIGIATQSIEESSEFWVMLGFEISGDDTVESQGVKIRYMEGDNDCRIELLEPLGEQTPVGKFIHKRGAGVQQVAVSVKDIDDTISSLLSNGVKMINQEPVEGSGGHRIAFIHPSSTGGVLVELVEGD
ncbi:MAG: methylmalonyl-CoA epimerase [Candidatus Thermoplasmatota archaeon]|nr:methylmalonyl-CoA epimerase [Candidatus Thermoplasmatota archaeon]